MSINRLQKLQPLLAEKGLDALLVSLPENYRYLSGFTGSSGWLLISYSQAILATDSRYTEQARQETRDFEIVQIKQELDSWLPGLVSNLGWHKLGFESDHVCYSDYHKLGETIKGRQLNLELIPTTGLVEHLRSVKEPAELGLIMQAVELTDAAFAYVKSTIRAGVTEKEAAWEVEKFLRLSGSEGVPFEIIVASGPDSALPHARPTERAIQPGEPVLIDMGARIGGYCSDFSRTSCLGKNLKAVSYKLSAMYNVVLEAELTAIDRIESGMIASEADRFARSVVEKAGYGSNFGHGLGHGVGLAIHELPTLSPTSPDLLEDGMVFTIEPGIYIAGYGGVRIEDTVTLEKGKIKVLTKSDKDSIQL